MAKAPRKRTTGPTNVRAVKTTQPATPKAESVSSGIANLSEGVWGFAARRWAKDLDAQQALMGCKTLVEIQELQIRYLSDAIHDYTVEMPKLFAAAASGVSARDGLSSGHADDHMGV